MMATVYYMAIIIKWATEQWRIVFLYLFTISCEQFDGNDHGIQ